MSALGCYAASVITSITVQNTCGVYGIHNVPPSIISGQIRAVMDDIKPAAVKIGMVNDRDSVKAIADAINGYEVGNLIIDPVMVSSTGTRLMNDDAIKIFTDKLISKALLLTPNIPEAEVLSGIGITDSSSMNAAAAKILRMGCRFVLIKGGHATGGEKTDRLYTFVDGKEEMIKSFSAHTISTRNTHGTGCTLSSAITAYIACGLTMTDAVSRAKTYLSAALLEGADVAIGKGSGPLCHFFNPKKMIKLKDE